MAHAFAPAGSRGNARRGRLALEAVRFVYQSYGVICENLSQQRASRISEGLPDMACFSFATGHFFFHEGKSGKGRRSLAQRRWRWMLGACGIEVVTGGVEEAMHWLCELGLAEPGPHGSWKKAPMAYTPTPIYAASLKALTRFTAAQLARCEVEAQDARRATRMGAPR